MSYSAACDSIPESPGHLARCAEPLRNSDPPPQALWVQFPVGSLRPAVVTRGHGNTEERGQRRLARAVGAHRQFGGFGRRGKPVLREMDAGKPREGVGPLRRDLEQCVYRPLGTFHIGEIRSDLKEQQIAVDQMMRRSTSAGRSPDQHGRPFLSGASAARTSVESVQDFNHRLTKVSDSAITRLVYVQVPALNSICCSADNIFGGRCAPLPSSRAAEMQIR